MKHTFAAVVALPLLACGNDLGPRVIFDIDGAWSYSETIVADASTGRKCTLFGTLTFAQENAAFVGTYSRTENCRSDGAAPERAQLRSGQIRNGKLLDEAIEFRIGSCDYRGTVDLIDAPLRLSGSILCVDISLAGTVTTRSGTWQGERLENL